MENPLFPQSVAHDWPTVCLERLRHVLERVPNEAPADLAPMEAFALIEWARIAMFAECHATGQGAVALALLKSGATSARDDALADFPAY